MGQYFLKKLADDKRKKKIYLPRGLSSILAGTIKYRSIEFQKRNVESCLLIVRSYVSPIEPTKLRSVVLLLVEGMRKRAREKEISRNFSLTFRHPRNSKRTTPVNDIRDFRLFFKTYPLSDTDNRFFIISFLFFTSVFRVTLESDLYKIA